jgi:antitoxin component YwqK of YwqJK toxin-antitoxin module
LFSYTIVQIPKEWPECNFAKDSAIRMSKYPNGEPKAMHSFLNAKLHGPSFLIAEDGNGRWAADYYDGNRHGSFRVWDENAKMALFAQYVRGGKKGFVCTFEDGMPWLVQEWDKDQKIEEYLIGWNAGVPAISDTESLSNQAEVAELARARTHLAELEDKLTDEETDVKRELAEWFRELDREIKQKRVAASSMRKRGETSSALKARSAAEQAALGALWRRAQLGR